LEISVVNRKDENVRLRFSVHDSGIGIPADRMDRLFKSFSQVDASTTRQYGGSGLGLAICKRIIELMQGRIWVETTNASGSIFCFEVSMAVGPANTAGNSKRAALLAGRRILIVDDSAMSRRALGQHCDAWRMSAHAVASGEAALAQVDQGTAFDLALIDIDMPGMSGTELVAALRRKRSAFQLPIAMLTRRGRPPDADELEIAAFVSKPVKAAALFDLLAEILDGRRATRSSGKAEGAALGVDHPLAILLAEDNPVNQRVAILMLQRLGYRADVAANGREALEAVERQRYDLVLMDVQMPEMDGLQAAREIRSRLQQRRPRIVAMTANASTSDREECFAAGMDDFLPKPVCGADLRKAILETPARYVASAA
jgi:CheY-like chemotaxis protein